MGLEKLLKKLDKHLTKREDADAASNCERIDGLIEKLVEKKRTLKQSLNDAGSKTERKHLKLELRIATRELKKARARRAVLEDKCQ